MHGDSMVVLLGFAQYGTLQMKVSYQLKLTSGEEVSIGTACDNNLVFDERGQAMRCGG